MPAPTSVNALLAKNLVAHRNRLGVSQVALAHAAGLAANTVGHIEKKAPGVRLQTLSRLSIALDLDPTVLLNSDDEVTPAPYRVRDLDDCVAQNLKRFRNARGLTQEDLSTRSGLDRKQVYKIESKNVSVRVDTLGAVAEALGVQAWQLLV
jgi:transcriptional regulator with XRE-family HTH domain